MRARLCVRACVIGNRLPTIIDFVRGCTAQRLLLDPINKTRPTDRTPCSCPEQVCVLRHLETQPSAAIPSSAPPQSALRSTVCVPLPHRSFPRSPLPPSHKQVVSAEQGG